MIAPVQAWGFANSLFDVRQARRLFGLIGAGASLGAIAGGLMARFLVGPVGGAANLLLVLALLIFLSAITVVRLPHVVFEPGAHRAGRRDRARRSRCPSLCVTSSPPRTSACSRRSSFSSPSSRSGRTFSSSLMLVARYGKNADAIVAFFGTFNFVDGDRRLLLQLFLTGPLLRRFGVPVAVILLPLFLAFGSASTLLVPGLLAVPVTNAADQGLRFSVDKAAYELLYLPIAPAGGRSSRTRIDIVVQPHCRCRRAA